MKPAERSEKRAAERNEARRVAEDVVSLAVKLAATLPEHSRKYFWREFFRRADAATRPPRKPNEVTQGPTHKRPRPLKTKRIKFIASQSDSPSGPHA